MCTIDFGDCVKIGIVRPIDLGDCCLLIGVVGTNNLGVSLLIDIARATISGGRLFIGNVGTIDSGDSLSIGIGRTIYSGEDPINGIVRTIDYGETAYKVKMSGQ